MVSYEIFIATDVIAWKKKGSWHPSFLLFFYHSPKCRDLKSFDLNETKAKQKKMRKKEWSSFLYLGWNRSLNFPPRHAPKVATPSVWWKKKTVRNFFFRGEGEKKKYPRERVIKWESTLKVNEVQIYEKMTLIKWRLIACWEIYWDLFDLSQINRFHSMVYLERRK